jgi:hypothetical protein
VKEFNKKALKEQYKNRVCTGGIYKIICKDTTKQWLRSTIDLKGSKNRFDFCVSANSCPEVGMMEEWKHYGSSSFAFEIVEEITKKDTQSEREFTEDVDTLLELWMERGRMDE